MLRRDLTLIAAGAVVTAAAFGIYRWQSGASAMDKTAPNEAVAQNGEFAPAGMAVEAGAAAGTLLNAAASMPGAGPASGGAAQAQIMKAPSVAESTAKLAARLEKAGGSNADWILLGKSYDFLGRTDEANAAYAHAGGRPAAGAADAAAANNKSTAATDSTRLTGTIEIAPRLRGRFSSDTTLFVLAKSMAQSGPPLAVIRLAAKEFPIRFTLDDTNAMMPSHNLSSAGTVIVEARISASGEPGAQPGDLSGSVQNIDPRKPKPLRIVIDHAVGAKP